MNSLERELETSSESEGLRKKQVKLDDQLMEVLFNQCWPYCIAWGFLTMLPDLLIYWKQLLGV